MNKFTTFLTSALLSCSAYAADKAKIELSNGDTITANNIVFSKDFITVETDYSAEPITFSQSSIRRLTYSDRKQSPTSTTMIATTKRSINSPAYAPSFPTDVFIGSIQKVEDNFITLDTQIAGPLRIKTKETDKIEIRPHEKILFRMPDELKAWKGKSSTWRMEKNILVSYEQNPFLSDEVPNDGKFSFEITLLGQPSTHNIELTFNSLNVNSGSSYNQEGGISFRTSNGNARIQRFIQRNPNDISGHLDLRSYNSPVGRTTYKFEIDNPKGIVVFYVNDILVKTCIDDREEKADLKKVGSHFLFRNRTSKKIKVYDVSATTWSSITPSSNLDQRIERLKTEGQMIKLQNHDILFGEIGEIKDNIVHIKTKYLDLNIPIENIREFSLNVGATQLINMRKNDVRVKFTDGTSSTFAIVDSNKTHITGISSQFDGKVKFSLDKVVSIEFDLYNKILESDTNMRSN